MRIQRELTYTDKVGHGGTEDIVAGEGLGDGNIGRECVRVLEALLSAIVKHKRSAEARYTDTALLTAQNTYVKVVYPTWVPTVFPQAYSGFDRPQTMPKSTQFWE